MAYNGGSGVRRGGRPDRATVPDGPPDDESTAGATGTTRRRVLAAAALALVGVGAVGYSAGTARADAAVDGLAVAGDAIETDNGRLLGLSASLSGHVSYDGLDTPAATVEVAIYAAPAGGAVDAAGNRVAVETVAVADEAGLREFAGHHDYAFADVDLLAAADLSANDFAAVGDGTTTDTAIDVRTALSVRDAGGVELVGSSATSRATISVTNQARRGGARGSGSTTAQGTDQSP